MSSRAKARLEAWGLAIAALAALALRGWRIGRILPDTDDITHYYFALKAGSLAQALAFARGNPMHVVLDPLAAFAVSRLSSSMAAFRLPSVVLGAASVVLIQRLGARLGASRAGWLACLLLACSMPHVEWCRRVDFYSPLVFFSILSVLTLLVGTEGEGLWRLAPHFLAQCGFLYAHPYAFVVAAAEGLWLLLYRRDALRPWLAWMAAAGLLYLPWYLHAMRPYLAQKLFVWTGDPGPRGWEVAASTLRFWGQSTEDSSYLFSASLTRLESGMACLYAVLFAGGCWALTKKKAWSEGWILAAALPWVGLGAVVALDRSHSFFFAPRQTIFLLPFYLLLGAEGLDYGLDAARPPAARLATASAAAGALIAFALIFRADVGALVSGQEARRGEIEALRAKAKPGDAFLLRDPDTAQAFLFEYDRRALLGLAPPELYGGRSQFLIPDGLSVRNASGEQAVYCLDNPQEGEPERLLRWAHIAIRVAGRRLYYIDYFRPQSLLSRFARATGLMSTTGH